MRRARLVVPVVLALALMAISCGRSDAAPPSHGFPTVDHLPSSTELPDLFGSFFDPGKRVHTADDFTSWRRSELLEIFTHYAYGPSPSLHDETFSVVDQADAVDALAVDYLEIEVVSGDTKIHVAIFSPAGAQDVPAVLGPNKCGNQTIVADERVRATTAAYQCTDTPRGSKAHNWPVDQITAAGLALVTFDQSELAPDDANLGVEEALSAWAAGSSAALDALESVDTPVDPARVAVFGHSRRGKAALIAGARDPRLAAVVAHQSGTLGSAIMRDHHGEPLLLITGLYPQWFTPELFDFVGQEDRLPFDQHELLALIAPRPLLLVDGDSDDWADPQGSLAAAQAADAVWELFGSDGLVLDDNGIPRKDATVVWETRPGGHDLLTSDWDLFLPFLEQHLE